VRPSVRGKFLWVGDEKLYLRGVIYGPFKPEEDGSEYHTPAIVAKDLPRSRFRPRGSLGEANGLTTNSADLPFTFLQAGWSANAGVQRTTAKTHPMTGVAIDVI